ncbi:peptidoglycan-binding protein [Candidatus Uhrbacteria bacterium]|nr:peptidoglycan-binding protein [Candidatus Uhrbacteria bacterium]
MLRFPHRSLLHLLPVLIGILVLRPAHAASLDLTPSFDTVPPAPPTNVIATGTLTAITLTWTDPTDLDLAHIEILRSTPPSSAVSGTPIATIGTQVQQMRDTSVQPNTSYTYILRAKDTSGNTTNSTAITVTAAAPEPPPEPQPMTPVTVPTPPPPAELPPSPPPAPAPVIPEPVVTPPVVAAPPIVRTSPPRRPTITHQLRSGSWGNEVRTLQTLLRNDPSARYRGSINGTFGPLTADALRRWQRVQRIPVTGRFDARTRQQFITRGLLAP